MDRFPAQEAQNYDRRPGPSSDAAGFRPLPTASRPRARCNCLADYPRCGGTPGGFRSSRPNPKTCDVHTPKPHFKVTPGKPCMGTAIWAIRHGPADLAADKDGNIRLTYRQSVLRGRTRFGNTACAYGYPNRSSSGDSRIRWGTNAVLVYGEHGGGTTS